MKNIFTCPMCMAVGIDNFEYYQEKVKTIYRKITKEGKVSTQILRMDEDSKTMPVGLHCLSCGEWLNYDTDNDRKIINIYFK